MTSNATKYDELARSIVALPKLLTPDQNRAIRNKTGGALTSALNAAFALAIAAGASSVWCADGEYKLDGAGVQIAAPLKLECPGPTKCIFRQTNASGNGISFDYPSLLQGGGMRGATVEAGAGWQTSGFVGVGSTGVGISATNINNLAVFDDLAVNNFDYSVTVKGCFGTHWHNVRALFFTHRGLQVDKSTIGIGADNQFIAWKASNFNFAGVNTASRGVDVVNSGGDTFISMRVTSTANSFVIAPGATDQVLYCHFTDCFGDTAINDCWRIDGTNGKVWENTFTACWGAYSTDGSGLFTTGANLKGLQWNGGQLRENGVNGWQHGGGVNVTLDNVRIVHNSKKTTNTSAGVAVAGGVSEWVLNRCRIGNDGTSTVVQGNGVEVGAGLSENFFVTNNDLRSPGSGKVGLVNGSSLLNWVVGPNLPLQSVGNNASLAVPLQGTLATAAAAVTSLSLGAFRSAKASVVSRFFVAVNDAPSSGQSFTYTLWVNGSATSMTGAISGTNTSVTVTANPQIIGNTDKVELKVTTSASAAVTAHAFYILQEP